MVRVPGPQQLVLAPVQAGQQPIQGHVAGAAAEDAVEAGAQGGGPARAGVTLPGLEVGVPSYAGNWVTA